MATLESHRPLRAIARDIMLNWKNVNYGAKPYLLAMTQLDHITDRYGLESADSIILYFLSNATTWRGEHARAIKAELNQMVKDYNKYRTV
jgi:hypothetical protein